MLWEHDWFFNSSGRNKHLKFSDEKCQKSLIYTSVDTVLGTSSNPLQRWLLSSLSNRYRDCVSKSMSKLTEAMEELGLSPGRLAHHKRQHILVYRTVQSDTVATSRMWVLKVTLNLPWMVWLSGLGIIPQTERLLVWFLVRGHAWVACQVPSWGREKASQSMFPSLPPSLPCSLKKKYIKSLKFDSSVIVATFQVPNNHTG